MRKKIEDVELPPGFKHEIVASQFNQTARKKGVFPVENERIYKSPSPLRAVASSALDQLLLSDPGKE